jgi:hypothetical protein
MGRRWTDEAHQRWLMPIHLQAFLVKLREVKEVPEQSHRLPSHRSYFTSGDIAPGWAALADPQLIMKSSHELMASSIQSREARAPPSTRMRQWQARVEQSQAADCTAPGRSIRVQAASPAWTMSQWNAIMSMTTCRSSSSGRIIGAGQRIR